MHLFIMVGLISVVIYFYMVGPSMSGQDPVGKFIFLFIIPIAVFAFSPLLFAVWVLSYVGGMGGNKR